MTKLTEAIRLNYHVMAVLEQRYERKADDEDGWAIGGEVAKGLHASVVHATKDPSLKEPNNLFVLHATKDGKLLAVPPLLVMCWDDGPGAPFVSITHFNRGDWEDEVMALRVRRRSAKAA